MEALSDLIKTQEFDIMKNLLYAKSILASGENNQELLTKASDYLKNVKDKYHKLQLIAESSTDFHKQLLNRKVSAYKQKLEEMQNDLQKIRESSYPASTNPMDNTLSSGLRSQQMGINTIIQLQSQRKVVQNFTNYSIKKDISESNSALIDLYVKKSKIKVCLVVIITLQVFIFLLVLKIKLS